MTKFSSRIQIQMAQIWNKRHVSIFNSENCHKYPFRLSICRFVFHLKRQQQANLSVYRQFVVRLSVLHNIICICWVQKIGGCVMWLSGQVEICRLLTVCKQLSWECFCFPFNLQLHRRNINAKITAAIAYRGRFNWSVVTDTLIIYINLIHSRACEQCVCKMKYLF